MTLTRTAMLKAASVFGAGLMLTIDATAVAAQTRISIGAAPPGGTFFQAGSAVAAVVNSKLTDVRAIVEITGATKHNLQLLQAGKVEFGMISTNVGAEAWLGIGEFDKKHDKLRMVIPGYPGANMFVSLKSAGITSLTNYVGKPFNVGPRGGAATIFAERVFETLGVKVSATHLGFDDAGRALIDGRVLGYCVQYPATVVTQQEVSHELTILFANEATLGPEAFKRFMDKHPGYSIIQVPAGAYKGVPQAVAALGTFNGIATASDVPVDLVYRVTKVLYENTDTIAKVWPALSDSMKLDNATIAYAPADHIPYHPGAIRYFEEKGLTIPPNLRR